MLIMAFNNLHPNEESFVTTFAACNDNDVPLSGGYSIVGAEEEQ